MEAFYSLAIYFVLDVYVKLEGRWYYVSGSEKYHSTFRKAKRYCSKTANCLGVISRGKGGYPIELPIELRQQGKYDIYKKENIFGNFHISIIVSYK